MYPTHGTPNFAAIERRAHELRREALTELSTELKGWVKHQIGLVQDVFASVRLRMQRNSNETFFEAQ